MFYKTIAPTYLEFVEGDVLLQGMAHYYPVKVGSPTSKTVFHHKYARHASAAFNPNGDIIKKGLEHGKLRLMERWEVIKIRHHMTWRIWINDGTFICNERDLNARQPNLAPLPPVICYDCMLEGNKWLSKVPPIYMTGKCICCNRVRFLHLTRYAWPLLLSHKGFGQSVIMTGNNYKINIRSMYTGKHMGDKYAGYEGSLDWFKIEPDLKMCDATKTP